MCESILNVIDVRKSYRKSGVFSQKRQLILKGVSFSMNQGECLGIIGESGSGKSTLGRIVLGIESPDSGKVLLEGKNVLKAKNRRGIMSAVFQDYTASICPNQTVYQAVKEPMDVLGIYNDKRTISGLLERVGLDGSFLNRFQHELSGGETQRVCIARAISTSPRFLLLDEAISSLDVTVQVQILDLLKQLRQQSNMSYLFITHDIQAAAYICDNLIIFNNGVVVEKSSIERISEVKEEYSQKLLNAVITV